MGFARGRISIGEIEVAEATTFEAVWSSDGGSSCGFGGAATVYKPVDIPAGFCCLGYYCQRSTSSPDAAAATGSSSCRIHGSLLVAKVRGTASEAAASPDIVEETMGNVIDPGAMADRKPPPLARPISYKLIWRNNGIKGNPLVFFWLPVAPNGYSALGVADELWSATTCGSHCRNQRKAFSVWAMNCSSIGMHETGIAIGTFGCVNHSRNAATIGKGHILNDVVCLRNDSPDFTGSMLSHGQVLALMSKHGPLYYFHPEERFFPSSVDWFFEQGALLHMEGIGHAATQMLARDSADLPTTGLSDGTHWIDLPLEGGEMVKEGNLASAKGYVQVKPMLGGTFTDLVVWIYYPFNGPSIMRLGLVNIRLGNLGNHVSDWEHVTLRISNFDGRLVKVYFAQHSRGVWLDASEVEYEDGDRVVVYASRHGHASYPHPGLVLRGSARLGIGLLDDASHSSFSLDVGKNFEIISAEYLELGGYSWREPRWLLYACAWGPKVVYSWRNRIDKFIGKLPTKLGMALQSLLSMFPRELSCEQGPTGPKFKNYWIEDER